MPFLLMLLSFAAPSLTQAQLPADVQSVIARLPNRKLSVELVLAKAYSSSDSIREVQAQALSIEADRYDALTPTATRMFLLGAYTENQSDVASAFDPLNDRSVKLGVSKYFLTGTNLALELGDSDSTYDPVVGNFFPSDRAYGKLSLSQNLWRDSFGYGTRRLIEAGKIKSEANQVVFTQAVETWALGLVNTFYTAWLAQTRLVAAKTNLERRERLLKITRLKLNRGTSERPDFLQVESALLQSRAEVISAVHGLQGIWRDLVAGLKLPTTWMELPGESIPLQIDEPHRRALGICAQKSNIEGSRSASLAQQTGKLRMEAAERSFLGAKNNYAPQLALEGEYSTNGAGSGYSDRTADVFAGDNPVWKVGLNFRMPLEFYKEKADLARAAAVRDAARASYSRIQTDHVTGWLNGCARLKALVESETALARAVKNLAERSALEEKRFQIGRTPTINVITAGDDYSRAELALSETRVALNQAAWDILKLNGSVAAYLNDALKSFGSVEL